MGYADRPAFFRFQIGTNGMIPAELKDAPRWLLWRFEQDARKVPYSIKGRRASSMNPAHWTNYDAVVAEYADDPTKYAGIGFVLGDGWCGIDIDNCRNKDSGEIHPDAQAIIDEQNSYTEISPSKTGVKIFCKGDVPRSYKRTGQTWGGSLEVYGKGRYFTVTGDAI